MAATGKRIGFVDYKLENFHANIYLKHLRNELKDRGFEVAGCWGMDEVNGRAWGTKNNVPYVADLSQLNGQVDCFMVLAPSNPELHLELCQKVFPFGKPTYVDKTFAPDLATAKRIFALADQYRVKMQTSSALRYTNVQKYVEQVGRDKVQHMVAFGGGSSFGEYSVHPLELVVSCMGPEVERVMRRGTGDQSQLLLDFSGGRTAVVNVYVNAETPFWTTVTTARETKPIEVDASRIFLDQTAAIFDLFQTGRESIDRRETLAIRAIQDAAGMPGALQGFVTI